MARTQAADYEQRREAIVDNAAILFARQGFHGASMADLAKACGMSKSLLYHYYAAKEDLLYAVMLSHVDQLVGEVDHVMEMDQEPTAKLSTLIHAFMTHYIGATDRQKVLLNELENLPPAQRTLIVSKQRMIIDSLQRLLVDIFGKKETDAEARVRTMLVFGMINWTHTWFDPSGPVSADKLANMVVDFTIGAARRDSPA
ncbi:MAG: TetR/AcrR family transcriptional regulator [Sphingomonas sp.]|jgi:AcrR family transcriptional regulator|uniref:TetR/AcrR family transcriptional regulator n=1 Tax=Sphingomonas sp. TaxID=28214 RepID=UPI003564FFCA